MAIPGKLEAAFGADRTADPLSWTLTDLTADTAQNDVTITRGQRGNATDVAAATMSVLLSNTNGQYTPRKAGTTPSYHPNMKRGLIVRHSVNTGARTLSLTGAAGSRASTPDAVSLDIVSDMAGYLVFRSPVRYPAIGFAYEVALKWGAAGQRSWRFLLGAGGQAFLQWSTDGTATSAESSTSLPVPRPDAGPLVIGWELDVDNGASGNTTTWYVLKGTGATLLADKTAYLFGAPDVNSGTTSIFSSTAVVEIGDGANSGFVAYPGGVDAFFLRAGTLTSGTIAANPDFTTQTVGAASFADTAGTPKTWTINPPASITDRKITILGTLDSNEGDYPGQSATGTAQRLWTINGPLNRMRRGQAPLQSALYRRITAPHSDTTVHTYFPLEEPSGAELVSSPTDGIPPGIMAMNLASDDTLPASKPLPSQTGGQPYGWNLTFPPRAPQTGWEGTWQMRLPLQPTGGEIVDQRIDTVNGTTSQWVFRMDSAGYVLFAKDLDGVNVLSAGTGTAASMYGPWNTVTVALAQNGANIDWEVLMTPLDGTGVTVGSSGTLNSFTLGSPVGFRTLSTAAPGDGVSFGHFIITDGAVLGWLAGADTAYVGEPAGSRVYRLFREEGVPILIDGPYGTDWDVVLAAGGKAMGPQRPGVSLLGYLDECALVEHGITGEARELLGLTYRSGSTLANQTARLALTSEVTSPLKPADDDRDLVNSVTVSRVNGTSVTMEDAASADPETGDGLYQDSREINPLSDLYLPDHASWWLHEALVEEERYDEIPIELAKNSAKIDDWYSSSHGDLVTAAALPAAEATTSLSQLVTGSTQRISPHLWTVGAATIPAAPWNTGVRGSATLGKRDTAGSTTSSLTTTATSATITTTLGPIWTTAGGDVPFDVNIDGERITVTAVSGASSPQTFTVTRSVNGVVASHSAGAAVNLWRPTVRAH